MSVRRLIQNGIVAMIIAIVGATLFNDSTRLRFVDEAIYAHRFPSGDPVSQDIVLVEITHNTLKTLGEDWPVDRKYHATVLEQLARDPSNVVGMTIVFPRPRSEPGDTMLAKVAAARPNIVFARDSVPLDNDQDVFYRKLRDAGPTNAMGSIEQPSDQQETRLGFATVPMAFIDPLAEDKKQHHLETMPLKLVKVFRNQKERAVRSVANLGLALGHPTLLFPLFGSDMPVNYVGEADAFTRIPYERFVVDKNAPSVHGKIIIIGLATPRDSFITPLMQHSGMPISYAVIVANAVNTLLTGRYIKVLPSVLVPVLMFLYAVALLVVFSRIQSLGVQTAINFSLLSFFWLPLISFFLSSGSRP